MTLNTKHKLGKESENIACNFLKQRDFSILNQNWHSGKYGEIDIIAKDNKTNDLVFVEVKSRKTSINDAKELITKKKQQQLYKLAKSYLFLKGFEDCPCRFDVIAIKINEKGKALEHIRDAF